MNPRPEFSAPQDELQYQRDRIDALDDKLIALLKERIGIVAEVGKLKARHWPASCHVRSGREGAMHARIARAFAGGVFSARAAVTIWRQLIGASTSVESQLACVALHSAPEHFWMAREYFGINSNFLAVANLKEALLAMDQKMANILLLPSMEQDRWWVELARLNSPYRLFARLPVLDEPLPEGMVPAVALAPITPEPSGDDISYFVRGEELIARDGFHSALDGAFWLGSMPRPLTIPKGD